MLRCGLMGDWWEFYFLIFHRIINLTGGSRMFPTGFASLHVMIHMFDSVRMFCYFREMVYFLIYRLWRRLVGHHWISSLYWCFVILLSPVKTYFILSIYRRRGSCRAFTPLPRACQDSRYCQCSHPVTPLPHCPRIWFTPLPHPNLSFASLPMPAPSAYWFHQFRRVGLWWYQKEDWGGEVKCEDCRSSTRVQSERVQN